MPRVKNDHDTITLVIGEAQREGLLVLLRTGYYGTTLAGVAEELLRAALRKEVQQWDAKSALLERSRWRNQ